MWMNTPYIPAPSVASQGPLSRFLPPFSFEGAVQWCRMNVQPGTWILDPFGASPLLPVEVARAGYRVLVAANNPVTRFLIEVEAEPPEEHDLRNALAYLAATRKGDERLEPHIKNLYSTNCEQCKQEIMAESFIWEQDASTPFAKVYECPHCGDSGERPVTQDDEQKAKQFTGRGLHRARALERIAPLSHPDRVHAEEALTAYLPRAVYALFTLINKLDSLPADGSPDSTASKQLKRSLDILVLSACDKTNTLWSYPTGRERPKQLTVPARFREKNVWIALEEAVEQFSKPAPAIQHTIWPQLATDEVGVTIFEGRLRDLDDHLQSSNGIKLDFDAVLTAIPRPNQAFWTLSALWAGWLWGREAVGPFTSVLSRRRYDWSWHTTALHAALSHIVSFTPRPVPFFGLLGETEPGYLAAVILAAMLANFKLKGLALRADEGQSQILWHQRNISERKTQRPIANVSGETSDPEKIKILSEFASAAAKQYLIDRAEPTSYLRLHAVGLSAMVKSGELIQADITPAEAYGISQDALGEAFTYRRGFLRFGGSEKSLEVGQWWLQEKRGIHLDESPLADRTEQFVYQYLLDHPECSLLELDTAVCKNLPGLLTPDRDLITECLQSYAKLDTDTGNWHLRSQDSPDARQHDLLTMRLALSKIGKDLGYSISGENPFLWLEREDQVAYVFYLTDKATFAEYLYSNPFPPSNSLIIYPGGRSNLLAYKLRHDARLKQQIREGWRLVKFRLLRRLAENPLINRDNFDEQLTLDPLMDDAPQMRLL